jgi:hypothetical protein
VLFVVVSPWRDSEQKGELHNIVMMKGVSRDHEGLR